MSPSIPPSLEPESPSVSTKAYFEAIPWCAKLMADPTLVPIRNVSRIEKPHHADSFMGTTLATPNTIPACQAFYRPPQPGIRGEVWFLIALESGLNGHADTAHGGLISVVLDEVIGTAAETGRPREKTTMTAYLKVDYKRPVRTPDVFVARAWLDEKSSGRKLFGRGTIEDKNGTILALGEALFIEVDIVKPRSKL